MIRFTHALLTAAFVAASTAGAYAASDAMASMAPVDCAMADHSMMMMPAAMPTMAPSSGNMDKDFAAMAAANAKMVMKMAHMEMSCGKDAKTRQAAKDLADQQDLVLRQLQTIWGDSI